MWLHSFYTITTHTLIADASASVQINMWAVTWSFLFRLEAPPVCVSHQWAVTFPPVHCELFLFKHRFLVLNGPEWQFYIAPCFTHAGLSAIMSSLLSKDWFNSSDRSYWRRGDPFCVCILFSMLCIIEPERLFSVLMNYAFLIWGNFSLLMGCLSRLENSELIDFPIMDFFKDNMLSHFCIVCTTV